MRVFVRILLIFRVFLCSYNSSSLLLRSLEFFFFMRSLCLCFCVITFFLFVWVWQRLRFHGLAFCSVFFFSHYCKLKVSWAQVIKKNRPFMANIKKWKNLKYWNCPDALVLFFTILLCTYVCLGYSFLFFFSRVHIKNDGVMKCVKLINNFLVSALYWKKKRRNHDDRWKKTENKAALIKVWKFVKVLMKCVCVP